MMGARRREKQMVNIRWQDGRVVGLPQGIKVVFLRFIIFAQSD